MPPVVFSLSIQESRYLRKPAIYSSVQMTRKMLNFAKVVEMIVLLSMQSHGIPMLICQLTMLSKNTTPLRKKHFAKIPIQNILTKMVRNCPHPAQSPCTAPTVAAVPCLREPHLCPMAHPCRRRARGSAHVPGLRRGGREWAAAAWGVGAGD